MGVQVTSTQGPTSPLRPCSLRLQDSLELGLDPLKNQDSMLESIESESLLFEFADVYGKNVQLIDDKRSAVRFKSYSHAMVCVAKPLCKGQSISVRTNSHLPIILLFVFQLYFSNRSKLTRSTPSGRVQSSSELLVCHPALQCHFLLRPFCFVVHAGS